MAMYGLSPSPSPTPSPSAHGQWAPHGQLLTGCVVALNVFVVLLIYFYFWRFFSRKGGGADEDSADRDVAASPPTATSPNARSRQEVAGAIAALSVFVHSSSSGHGNGTAAVECAICIAEFGDGEEGRILPRCGHRFHARCVDVWFHLHTTCPLCRRSVLKTAGSKDQLLDTMSTNCPV